VNYQVDKEPLNEAIDLLICSFFLYLSIFLVGKKVSHLNVRVSCNEPGYLSRYEDGLQAEWPGFDFRYRTDVHRNCVQT
jgi:hypothetical protein